MYNTTMTDIANNHTLIDFSKPDGCPALTVNDKFIFVGSCFSDEMAKRLTDDCMDTIVNPFGTIYNPVSILDCLQWCLSDKQFGTNDVLEFAGIYFTPYHSTIFDSCNSNKLLESTNNSLEAYRSQMRQSSVFLITYGTAVVWEYNGRIMANCHKIPQTNFTRGMLTAQEITQATQDIVSLIRQYNPNAKIIFTISPVRHKNPDLLTNSYSKALLKVGLTEALSACDGHCLMYFPSFEIVIDQLRDYAHYTDDGVHLTDHAADYIYDVLLQTCFESDSIDTIHHISRLLKIIGHRTAEHNQAYYDNMEKALKELQTLQSKCGTNRIMQLINEVENKIIAKIL
ncbi:MAG: GSCFA domain-containing protein [Spirochaetales bacterium]|nr:GSCFA domain-containing protein [Spirochaetales bacterium]